MDNYFTVIIIIIYFNIHRSQFYQSLSFIRENKRNDIRLCKHGETVFFTWNVQFLRAQAVTWVNFCGNVWSVVNILVKHSIIKNVYAYFLSIILPIRHYLHMSWFVSIFLNKNTFKIYFFSEFTFFFGSAGEKNIRNAKRKINCKRP